MKDEKRLAFMIREITPGDPKNIEAQAAKLYWKNYFSCLKFADDAPDKRHKQGAVDIVNSALNYGYSIIRAMVARSLAGAGLCLNFGHGHYRRDNPMNLVEDWVEPLRYFVDICVLEIMLDILRDKEKNHKTKIIFDKNIKQDILQALLASEITIEGKNWRILEAIDHLTMHYCQWLQNPKKRIILPQFSKHKLD